MSPIWGHASIAALLPDVRKPRKGKSKPPAAKQPLQRSAYQSLTRALRNRADELDLSVRDIAAALHKPRTTVHKTLRGQRRMDPIEFVEWCEVLQVSDPLALIISVRRK